MLYNDGMRGVRSPTFSIASLYRKRGSLEVSRHERQFHMRRQPRTVVVTALALVLIGINGPGCGRDDVDSNDSDTPADNKYIISADPNDPTFGSVKGAGVYPHFHMLTLEANANTGYHFVEWREQIDGDWVVVDAAEEAYEFMVEEDRGLLAVFEIDTSQRFELVLKHGANGTTSGAGFHHLEQEIGISATANTGYMFARWSGDVDKIGGFDKNDGDLQLVRMPAEPVTLMAHFVVDTDRSFDLVLEAIGNGLVYGSGCYSAEDDIAIEAVANAGYRFEGWSGDVDKIVDFDDTVSDLQELQMPATDVTMTGHFVVDDAQTFALTVTADPKGSIANDYAGGEYPVETVIDLLAMPNAGYKFDAWVGEIAYLDDPESANATVTIPGRDISLSATFEIDAEYFFDLTLNVEGKGQAFGPPKYNAEDEVTISATSDAGHQFIGWTGDVELIDGFDPNTDSAQTVVMPAVDVSLTANFSIYVYNIAVASNGSALGTTAGDGEYEYGEEVVVVATPHPSIQSRLISWTEEGDDVSVDETYSFIAESDRELLASFELYCILTVDVDGEGAVEGLRPDGRYSCGDPVELEAIPEEGWRFVGWTVDGVVVSIDEVYTFKTEDNLDLTANFSLIEYKLVYIAGDKGNVNGVNQVIQNIEHDRDGEPVTAYPNTGYYFDSWSDGISDNPRTDTNVTDGFTVEAYFEPNVYTVSFVVPDVGYGHHPPDSMHVIYGQPYGELAVPDPRTYLKENGTSVHQVFVGWYYDGKLVTAETIVDVSDDHELVSHWLPCDIGSAGEAICVGNVAHNCEFVSGVGYRWSEEFCPDGGYCDILENARCFCPDGQHAEFVEPQYEHGICVDNVNIEWCNVQLPKDSRYFIDYPLAVYGQVYAEDHHGEPVTGHGERQPGIRAQLFYTDQSSGDVVVPAHGTFNEFDDVLSARYFADRNSNDEYTALVAIDSYSEHFYYYAFSGDGGVTWRRCAVSEGARAGRTGRVYVADAEQMLFESLGDGEAPSGWSEDLVSFVTSVIGGYARLDNVNSWLLTESVELVGCTDVYLMFEVAKWGVGDDGPVTARVYDVGEGDPFEVYDSPIPIDSRYLVAGPIRIDISSSVVDILFTREDSPSRKRLRNVEVFGYCPP